MHTHIPIILLLFSSLVLATTTTAPPNPESSPVGPSPPPLPPQPSPPQPSSPQPSSPQPSSPQPPPPQDLPETHEQNPFTHFITKKLSTPRKWRLAKKPAPPALPASSAPSASRAPPPPPPSSSATPAPAVIPPVSSKSSYTDPVKFQRFVKGLRANRRPSRLRRRGIFKSKSESLLPAPPEAVETEELTEAEFNAMFEEYRLKHDVAVGSARPKGERWRKWEGTEYGGYIEALMGAPGRGGRIRGVQQ